MRRHRTLQEGRGRCRSPARSRIVGGWRVRSTCTPRRLPGAGDNNSDSDRDRRDDEGRLWSGRGAYGEGAEPGLRSSRSPQRVDVGSPAGACCTDMKKALPRGGPDRESRTTSISYTCTPVCTRPPASPGGEPQQQRQRQGDWIKGPSTSGFHRAPDRRSGDFLEARGEGEIRQACRSVCLQPGRSRRTFGQGPGATSPPPPGNRPRGSGILESGRTSRAPLGGPGCAGRRPPQWTRPGTTEALRQGSRSRYFELE